MQVYRKKPVEVQAVQLTQENAEEVAIWCGGQIVTEIDTQDDSKRYAGINLPTLEGVTRVSEGDYVVKGSRGEFYRSKQEAFTDAFEPI